MKTIPLRNSKLVAMVDDEDFFSLSTHPWRLHTFGYAVASVHHAPGVRPANALMHNAILWKPKGNTLQTDHINGNKLDNRRSNLRIVSQSENIRNQGPREGKKFKGVNWQPDKGKWRAYITLSGKYKFLGHFDTPEEAARKYDDETKRLFPNNIVPLNFPKD